MDMLGYYPDDHSAEAAAHNGECDRERLWREGCAAPAETTWERIARRRQWINEQDSLSIWPNSSQNG